jgi:hypothetical protein
MASQQINLLERSPVVPPSLVWGVLALLLWAAACLGWGGWLLNRNEQQARQLAEQELVVDQLRTALARQPTAPGSAADRHESVEALRSRVQQMQRLAERLRQEGLDRPPPHRRALLALEAADQPPVWLVQIALTDGGRRLALQGRAAEQAAVLAYQARLRSSLAALALAPRALQFADDGAASAPAPALQAFRLDMGE